MTTSEDPSAVVRLFGVSRAFGGRDVLRGVALTLAPGSVTALTGPSGAGKTTLLRLIAGLDVPDEGEITLSGRPATSGRNLLLQPHERGIGMVFQQPALWPHMSVREQVEFGLVGLEDAAVRARTDAALALAEVAALADARPDRLSGGEAARVAIARALAPRPRCLLFDEPLAHLDAALRHGLAETIHRASRDTGAAVLIVTHTPEDLVGTVDQKLHLADGRLGAL